MRKNTVLLFIVGVVCAFVLICCAPREKKKEIKMVEITKQGIKSNFSAKPDESINFKKVADHFEKYPERWNATFKFLSETDLKTMPLGRIDLSDDVFVAVSEYETKNPEDAKFESHIKYIDLQYLISGEELIGLTNEKNLLEVAPYSESNDITFYNFDGGKLLEASPQNYFIFFPEDIHRPCIKTDQQQMVKKVVVKIKTD
jgi:YhcH/YjgK/YiaL family protein